MKKTAFVPIIISSLIICFFSCTKYKGVPVAAKPDTVDSSRLVNVTYSGDITAIMAMYCYGEGGQSCHVTNSNMGAVGDFTTYAGLKQKVDNLSIQSRVFDREGSPMPPANSNGPKQLTATDMAVFKKWVENGAPNN